GFRRRQSLYVQSLAHDASSCFVVLVPGRRPVSPRKFMLQRRKLVESRAVSSLISILPLTVLLGRRPRILVGRRCVLFLLVNFLSRFLFECGFRSCRLSRRAEAALSAGRDRNLRHLDQLSLNYG